MKNNDQIEKLSNPTKKTGANFCERLTLFFSLILMLFLSSCIDEFWPDLDNKYENLLVVDGMITTAPGPYTIRLSHSSNLNNPVYSPLSGYVVIIADDVGNSETLEELEEGTYTTKADGIQGIVGRSYKLILHDPNGKKYESEFEKLIAPMEIDTLYANVEYREHDNFSMDIPGYQFYIGTKPGIADTNFIRWQLEQTYKYTADFLIYFYFDGTLHPFPKIDSLETCWKTTPVYSIFSASTAGLNEPVISGFPLHYISFYQRDFSIRYSLLVSQLTIGENAFNYWQQVNEQNTAGDGLYSQVPYQIRGNVYNIADPDEPVLGYFQAAGLDQRRIFMDRPPAIYPMYYPICELTQPDYEEYGWMFRVRDPREWPIYVTIDANNARAVPVKACVDCQQSGGTIVKPDFWEDE